MTKQTKYSALEGRVLDILGDRKATVKKLATIIFDGSPQIPLDINNSIISAVRQINRKNERDGVNWFINGMGGGRGGRTIWVDKIKRK